VKEIPVNQLCTGGLSDLDHVVDNRVELSFSVFRRTIDACVDDFGTIARTQGELEIDRITPHDRSVHGA
jgi:hypothetical protein